MIVLIMTASISSTPAEEWDPISKCGRKNGADKIITICKNAKHNFNCPPCQQKSPL